ncbi:MAG: Cell envelope-related transcriptional attenuator [Candidatus Moranbacteria bacterium GW2011_GWE2_47_10]|nr:MAG: Cell envelope-related transcriptional attenuator [Candidatus Moranbacteria bacterium GW2011_GWE2_47_10]
MNRAAEKDGSKIKKGKGRKALWIILGLFLLFGGIAYWKAGSVFNKVSTNGGLFQNLISAIPGVNDEVKGESEDRINIVVLGMRGANIPGGGTLADTIMVVSVKPKENKVSMLSIPRDLYVDNPALGAKSKINAVYAYGEQKEVGQGLEDMKKVLEDVTGLPVHYGVVINFKGFSDLVDAIGGVDVDLQQPFSEPLQFNEARVCDDTVFTVPTGEFEIKKNKKNGKITAQYPLCTNPDLECGGAFNLPAGKQTLNGENALCFVRARKSSSDFDRARRQQLVIQEIKEKALSLGTLTDFSKISDMLDSLGNNAQTDMQLWEMKKMFELYKGMVDPQMYQRVLDDSSEGLLYFPPAEMYPGAGSILLPSGDNYDKIREMAQNIFSTK